MSNEVEQACAAQPLAWPERFGDRFGAPELGRWFEGLRPWSREEWRLQIEEQVTDDTMVLRAQLPGIEPDKDVEITVSDGLLQLRVQHRFEKTEEEKRTCSEFRYGSFARTVPVPRGLSGEVVTASYHDGILEVPFPCKVPTEDQVHSPIARA
jgi:HSP20 family protein